MKCQEELYTLIILPPGLKIPLKHCLYFSDFDNQIYKQKKGTAMGTKVAPTYANLVMGYWETRLYKEVAVHFKVYSMYFMQNWKRYLDDCLIMWPES